MEEKIKLINSIAMEIPTQMLSLVINPINNSIITKTIPASSNCRLENLVLSIEAIQIHIISGKYIYNKLTLKIINIFFK